MQTIDETNEGLVAGADDAHCAIGQDAACTSNAACASNAAWEEALARLGQSGTLGRFPSSLRLIRYLVAATEQGREPLRENEVGMGFFNKASNFDPRQDSIVRVTVKRLRERLGAYYEGEGSDDPFRIEMPIGSFQPVLVRNAEPASVFTEELDVPASAVEEIPPTVVTRVSWFRSLKHQGLVLAGLLLLVLGAVGFLRWQGHAGTPDFVTESLHAVPLTTGRDLEFEPSTSRDGSRIAYVTRAPGSLRFQIYTRPYGGQAGAAVRLDTGEGDAVYPAWSPSGRQIAFLRCGNGSCEIATVPAAGGGVRVVKSLPVYTLPEDHPYYQYRQINPVWTRDERSLIFPYRGENDRAERLIEVDLGTGSRRTLTSGAVADEDGAPTISPDGRTVAFLRRHLSTTQVMTVDLASLRTKVLETEANVTASGLTWAPDGSGIIVGINRLATGAAFLWVSLTGQTRLLNVTLPLIMNPVFQGDGKHLMALSVSRTRNLTEVNGQDGKPENVFPSKQRNSATAFSPDGSTLAFLSDRAAGVFEVWLSKRTGSSFGEPRQVTHGLGFYPSSLTWSPDGSMLGVGFSNSHMVRIIDLRSGAMEDIRLPGLEGSVVWSPVWSPDGHWMYFSSWGERQGIFRASTGPVPGVEQLYAGRAREVRLDEQGAVYFTPFYGQGIWALETSGQAHPVPGSETAKPGRAWFVRSGGIFAIDSELPDRRLRRMDLKTGETRAVTGNLPRVALLDGTISYLAPEHLLVYSQWAEAAGAQVVTLESGVKH